MNNIQPVGQGARPRVKDKRDYKLANLGMGAPYPATFQSPTPMVYMQGTYGTCGGHAGVADANVAYPGKVFSPKYLWKQIKQIDGLPLNAGTDMRSIFQAMQPGICELSLLDNNLEQSIEQYSDPAEITPAMRANAAQYPFGPYGFVDNPTWAQICQAIYQYGAVILLVDCGDGWWLPNWGPVNNPLHLGNFVGHHFICANGYGLSIIDGPNSWSTAWGDQGMFKFDASFLPHVLEMGTITKLGTKYIFNNNLYFGMMNNADVHALQARLGMDLAYQTGNFFAKTFAAVVAYQKANGIPATGFVGPLTRAALNK